jgi:hypothetical protein
MGPILSLPLHHSQPITNGSNIGEAQGGRMIDEAVVRRARRILKQPATNLSEDA